MSEFRLYIDLGLFHILDFSGYDHMLFVMAISAIYLLNDWRKVLVLITAFTIGHSITLTYSRRGAAWEVCVYGMLDPTLWPCSKCLWAVLLVVAR